MEVLAILSNLIRNRELLMDLIKLNGTESNLELIQRDCEAYYKELSKNFHQLLKNVEGICKQDSLSMKNSVKCLTKK